MTKSATSDTAARFIDKKIALNSGSPAEVNTDRGNHFTAAMPNDYSKLVGVKHVFTSAYYSRADGAIEQLNRLFNGMPANYAGNNHVNEWDQYVERALLACRIRQHQLSHRQEFLLHGVRCGTENTWWSINTTAGERRTRQYLES